MIKEIYLAGGCFWGVDAYFDKLDGVEKTQVGYANGRTKDTSYENLFNTGHAETVKLIFDDEKISLDDILEHFYYIIDPFSINKQGNDRGAQYRTGIYSKDPEDLKLVRSFLDIKQSKEDRKIAVEVEILNNFIVAEDYHQDYLKKNPTGYCHIDLGDVLKL